MKYSKEKTKEICKYLEQGLNRTDVVILADICYDTFLEWMKKPEFSEAIKKAEVKCKKFHIDIIKKAAEKTWTAAAWWLERKYKDEFALRHEIGGVENKPLEISIVNKAIEKIYGSKEKTSIPESGGTTG